MLSSSIPGAQRVIVRQVRRQRPLLKVGGLVGCPSAAEVGAISRRLTIFNVNHQVHLDGSCFARTGTINSITSTSTSTSTSMKSTSGRLHFSSNYSRCAWVWRLLVMVFLLHLFLNVGLELGRMFVSFVFRKELFRARTYGTRNNMMSKSS